MGDLVKPANGSANNVLETELGFPPSRSELIRRFAYPIYQRRQTPDAFRFLDEMRKWEFAPWPEVEKIQWQRLAKILAHAARNVPYYREQFQRLGIEPGDIRSSRDFARLPILSKSTVQASLDRLISENRDKREGEPNASGGSTGKPVQFYQDRAYWNYAQASLWSVESWWGIRPGDRTASVWGCDRDIPEMGWRERLAEALAQTRYCNAFSLTEPRMEAFARMLMKWQPRYMTGYASAMEIFSRYVLDHPEYRIRIHAARATADVLSEERRAVIEKAFGCRVYNFYGSREVNNLAAECEHQNGLHVNALGRFIEVVDDAGNPVPPGIPGRLLLTDLTNYFMPFLRYEIEDIASWSATPCPCGRPSPLLARVWGRASDFIVTPTGKLIHSVFFTHLFYDMPQIALFQVNQTSLQNVSVLLVLRPGVSDYPKELLRRRFEEAFGPGVTFEIRVVPEIQRPASGKHRFTVSSVRGSWGADAHAPLEVQGVKTS
jgi:phenylacetate-CoA ligase